ncbi:peptidylprolyl isomerase [Pandoraea terrae]|uniref:peptidylprolyl isomerase n=1 Tax=Pandoraea terrae TaxID=1537710 RepID=A0A5E4SD81_9BURK|nr:peptidylprolyl isomerase [Pandoraea terrae]VVD73836.1 peptidylprolyl isomerase [Pandoraea terrae]
MALKLARTVLALAATVSLPAFAQNVAVVNGTPVPVSRANAMVAEMVRQGQPDSPQLQQQVREELVKREILAQEAVRRGIPARPDVKFQVEMAKQTVLIRALIADVVKTPVSDAELQSRYDQIKKQFGDKEYHARHILVPSEDLAKEIIAKLKGGAKFADLAKQYSKDPGSAQNGGDLDWSPANAYVPEFAAALGKLQKGQMTDAPVKTNFGYHVIQLDDVRDAQIPSLAEVKPQLEQQMREEKLQKFEQELEKKAKIQ